MEKIIIKHYENSESALDGLYDALESISFAKGKLKEKKYKDALEKIANDIDSDIQSNDTALTENMVKWEKCLGKYYKAKCDRNNYLLHPYALTFSNRTLAVIMADMDDRYEAVHSTTIYLEEDIRDWELEEITREEFKALVAEQALTVVDYRYTRNIEKSQTNCKTDEGN